MLVDLHSKGNILIIQIEGNLEPDKLEILNFQIRCFCRQKKIRSPRFLFIIPSLYPESITANNIALLFKFMEYPELKIHLFQIKILSACKDFLQAISKIEVFKDIEIANNFIEAVQKLNLDIDNKKDINLEHLQVGTSYIFDLYDDTGMVRIPALTKLTQEMLDYFKKIGEKKFTYYSETSIEDANKNNEIIYSKKTKDNLERMLNEYEQIDEGYDVLKTLKGDKIKLFLSKLKDHNILVVSANEENNQIIENSLNNYANINIIKNVKDMSDILDKNYISIFLDIELNNPSAIELLMMIRSKYSRRQTSVIIIAKTINKEIFNTLKANGTDNILLAPFTPNKVIQKMFESVSADRGT
jgi:CheY-like chemotaxis protein